MAPPTSTRISARLKRVQECSSPVNVQAAMCKDVKSKADAKKILEQMNDSDAGAHFAYKVLRKTLLGCNVIRNTIHA